MFLPVDVCSPNNIYRSLSRFSRTSYMTFSPKRRVRRVYLTDSFDLTMIDHETQVAYTDCSTTNGVLSLDPLILRFENKTPGFIYGNSGEIMFHPCQRKGPHEMKSATTTMRLRPSTTARILCLGRFKFLGCGTKSHIDTQLRERIRVSISNAMLAIDNSLLRFLASIHSLLSTAMRKFCSQIGRAHV